MTTHSPPLARTTSFFLDLLRLVAAFSVFVIHVIAIWYPAHYTALTDRSGERSVIIFFVLSGYVIAYSTLRKERDPRGYVLARLSRLYSVLLPALLLTAALQVIGTAVNPGPYHHVGRGHDSLRYGMVALFLQSVWFVSTAPPTNGPFWSLCHEFWYYALFGAAILIESRRWKIGVMAGCALICGPTVLLLMPSWLLGASCYAYGRVVRVPKTLAAAGLVLAPHRRRADLPVFARLAVSGFPTEADPFRALWQRPAFRPACYFDDLVRGSGLTRDDGVSSLGRNRALAGGSHVLALSLPFPDSLLPRRGGAV